MSRNSRQKSSAMDQVISSEPKQPNSDSSELVEPLGPSNRQNEAIPVLSSALVATLTARELEPPDSGLSDSTDSKKMEPTIDSKNQEQIKNDAGSNKMGTVRRRLVMFSLCMALFLAALDVTIVATALPTIASHLNIDSSSYSWVGSAYTLASTSTTPLWAKFSDIFGRKPILLLANLTFLAGSLVAVLSRSIGMLICGRAIQGMGSGGLFIMVTVIIGDLFVLRDRAKYYGMTAIVWAIASGIGPVLGGVFTQTLSWRWCFFINLPFDGLSLVVLFFAMNVKNPRMPLIQGLKSMDWIGSMLLVGGTICFLYGLESGSSGKSWHSAFTICLLVFGIVIIGLFCFYESKAKNPIIPLRIFAVQSNLASLATSCFHSIVFISYDYYLPYYFQRVLGSSPILSGVSLFALVLPLSALTFGTGIFIRKTGTYLPAIWFGVIVMTIGTGLFLDFRGNKIWWKIILYQVFAGVGAGPLFQGPMISLQSHIHGKDLAAASSALTFLRNLSTSISIVIGGVVLQRGLGKQHENGTEQYALALRNMWGFYTGVCGLMIISSLFIAPKDLKAKAKNEEPKAEDQA